MIDFCSPKTGEKLQLQNGFLVSHSGEKFPVVKGIPRFVGSENYASAFGLQWKSFAKTQLDSHATGNITRARLERCLGFQVEQLNGKTILEVGCGAGRFTELLVKGGAFVHSIDLSVAVEANKENIGEKPNYKIAQASVYEIPYPDNSFDIVLCLGVVQHTPDSEKTIESLMKKVKPSALLVIDHYKWRIGYYLNLKPLYRAFLRRMKPERSKKAVDGLVKFFFPLHWAVRKITPLNWLLHRVSPVMEYFKLYPEYDRNIHYEWSRLDSYDSLTDYYKHLRTASQIKNFLLSLGATDIWIKDGGNGVEARCRKHK